MMLSGDLRMPELGRIRRVALPGLLLLTLVLMLACGGDANVGQTSGSGGDAPVVSDSTPQPGSGEGSSSPFSATPQPPSQTEVVGGSPGPGPAAASDNPRVANPAVGGGPATVEPSAASDPGGGPATEPGVEPSVSNDPIRTWAITPGVDPGEVNDMKGTPLPTDEAPSEMPSGAPQASVDDVAELVQGNAQFAFDLYRELSGSDGNPFLFAPQRLIGAWDDLRGSQRRYGDRHGGGPAVHVAAGASAPRVWRSRA